MHWWWTEEDCSTTKIFAAPYIEWNKYKFRTVNARFNTKSPLHLSESLTLFSTAAMEENNSGIFNLTCLK